MPLCYFSITPSLFPLRNFCFVLLSFCNDLVPDLHKTLNFPSFLLSSQKTLTTLSKRVFYLLAFFLLIHYISWINIILLIYYIFPLQTCELYEGKSFICICYRTIPNALNSFWHQVGAQKIFVAWMEEQ